MRLASRGLTHGAQIANRDDALSASGNGGSGRSGGGSAGGSSRRPFFDAKTYLVFKSLANLKPKFQYR
jgi:hypothetical protein